MNRSNKTTYIHNPEHEMTHFRKPQTNLSTEG